MEISYIAETVYTVKVTLTKDELSRMASFVHSAPAYTGHAEFSRLIKGIQRLVEDTE